MKLNYEWVEGKFIEKINRFLAWVEIDGILYKSHIPNTGRLNELLFKGNQIVMSTHDDENRKTNFSIRFAYKDGELFSIDSQLPNKIVEEALINKSIIYFRSYDSIKSEKKILNSRFDFYLEGKGQKPCFIEVKGVTLEKDKIASFPDAPTKRGIRHIKELIELKYEGFRVAIVFLVQFENAKSFHPNYKDKEFIDTLIEGKNKGVEIYAYRCFVNRDEVLIDIEIPVEI
ncbi:MAG: DNA/RNA nuclease SfsA [Clostridiales bacterium]|nr:DNA/RNA nuclease SfsA [Clostridiales bacterium]